MTKQLLLLVALVLSAVTLARAEHLQLQVTPLIQPNATALPAVNSGQQPSVAKKPAGDVPRTVIEKFLGPSSVTPVVVMLDAAEQPQEVPSLKAVFDSNTAQAVPGRAGVRRKAGVPSTKTYLAKDVNYESKLFSASMNINKGSDDSTYTVKNIYNLGYTVNMIVDSATGRVKIPSQVMFTHKTYGDVCICPISISTSADGSTRVTYSMGTIEGTVDANGVISLGSWGIIVTGEGNYKGSAYNFFASSTWNPTNATVTATDALKNKEVTYPIFVEQTGENVVQFYCLSGVSNEVIAGRLTPGKTVQISPQFVLSNATYGPFNMYNCSLASDGKVTINTLKSIVGSETADGALSIGSWAIAARSQVSTAMAFCYKDIKIAGDVKFTYPAQTATNFEGSGSEASPYLIKSYDDLKALAQAVAGGESYAGTHFALAADLDLSSVNKEEYVPVGDVATPFAGIFDGRGHTITGLKIDGKGFPYVGIFGNTGAQSVIKNLNVTKVQIEGEGDFLGTIVGLTKGTISNCGVSATAVRSTGIVAGGIAGGLVEGSIAGSTFSGIVQSYGTAAGIVGQMKGAVNGCTVKANVKVVGYITSDAAEAAGIAGAVSIGSISDCQVAGTVTDSYGAAATGGLVGRCYKLTANRSFNTALIQAKRLTLYNDTYTGGLVAFASTSDFTDCYNAGTILKSGTSNCTGGLVGYLSVGYLSSTASPIVKLVSITHFKNCYNSGQLVTSSSNGKKGIYGDTYLWEEKFTIDAIEDSCFSNSYYDKQVSIVRDDKFGRPTSFFTSGLIDGYDAGVWTAKAGHYPVLTQAAATQAAAMSSTALVLPDSVTVRKVKTGFTVTTASDVNWGSYTSGGLVAETDALKLSGNTFTVKNQYADAIVGATTADGWGLKVYHVWVVPDVFDGDGTAQNPYLLKTLADWQQLHNAIMSGQGHDGDHFAMANDIDFGYTDKFHGVGFGMASAIAFDGELDGRNHTVSKLKIHAVAYDADSTATDDSKSFNGLIGVVGEHGVVKNITIASDCDFDVFSYAGAIAGLSVGRIENCRNYAALKCIYQYAGGIVGANNGAGVVTNCYNAGKIDCGYSGAGGIAGYNAAAAQIVLSQNDGNVTGRVVNAYTAKDQSITLGGIVGSSYGIVDRSVNNATVTGYDRVGGIAGLTAPVKDVAGISNCVNNGFVDVHNATTYRGGLAGFVGGNTHLSASIYDASINVNGAANNTTPSGAVPLATADMTSGNVPSGFNADDFDFAAGKYPVLKARAGEAATQALRTMWVGFAGKQVRTNVHTAVPLATTQGISFALSRDSDFHLANGQLTVTEPTGMQVIADTLTATLGSYVKTYYLSSIPVILKGGGTADDPYLIETPADWNKLARFMEASGWEYPSTWFQVVNDLDFAGDSLRAIAVNGTNFQGTFDGNGKTVSNYVYSNTNSSAKSITGTNLYLGTNIGPFGTVGNTGVVKNLTLNGTFEGAQSVGGVAGNVYGVIENCVHKGKVSNTRVSCASGIAHRVWDGGVIRNCRNEGSVNAVNICASGIVNEVRKGGLVENCVNSGSLTTKTTIACGIAYTCSGTIRNCYNRGKLSSLSIKSGNASGIVNTIGSTGILENCGNEVDIDYGTTAMQVYGVFCKTSNKGTGYARNCYNTGNLTAKSTVYGLGSSVYPGFKLIGCYNTGNLTAAAGSVAGLVGSLGTSSSTEEMHCVMDSCYNTGRLVAKGGSVGGLVSTLERYCEIKNSYNLGDIVTTDHTSLTQGGLAAKVNGHIDHCFNAGLVSSSGNAVGGLAGYIATSTGTKSAVIENCFNLGDVISTYTGKNTQGDAGGLVGYLSVGDCKIINCYNAGHVSAPKNVGGLAGGMFRAESGVLNCYNSGKVVCTEDASPKHWSGTIYCTSPTTSAGVSYFASSSRNYYDATVSTGEEFRNFPGSAKTTQELASLAVGDAYVVNAEAGYPTLQAFATDTTPATAISAAMVLLEDSETLDSVMHNFTLIGPAYAMWTATDSAGNASDCLDISNGQALLKSAGKVLITVADPTRVYHKTFEVVIRQGFTAVAAVSADKPIVRVECYDLQGHRVLKPEPGTVVIERNVYSDGSSVSTKRIAR